MQEYLGSRVESRFSHAVAAITAIADNAGVVQDLVASGGVTDDTTLTIIGTLSAALATGEIVHIYDGAKLLGSAIIDSTGTAWSFTTMTLTAGVHSFVARVADTAGNLSPEGVAYVVTIDLTAPSKAATIAGVSDNVGPLQGIVAKGSRTDDTSLALSGTLTTALLMGETIRIYDGFTYLGQATITGSGLTWSYTDTRILGDGQAISYTARVADRAGNLGPAGAAYSITIDTTAPSQTAAIANVSDNVGLVQGSIVNGGVSDDTILTLSGTYSAALLSGESLRIFDGNTLLGIATIYAATRTWIFTTTTLSTGSHSFVARVADAAGNLGAAAAPFVVTIDTSVPAITARVTDVQDDVGIIQGFITSGGVSDDATLVLRGTLTAALAAGERIRVYDGSMLLGNATVNSNGLSWSFTTATLTSGFHSFSARIINSAGKLGPVGAAYAITIDTTAPSKTAAVTSCSDNAGLIHGRIINGGVSDDTTLTLSGTYSATLLSGESLRIFDGNTLLGAATINIATRTWIFTTATLSAGSHSFTARIADAAGNLGAAGNAFVVAIDTSAPTIVAEVVDIRDNAGIIQGAIAKGGFTDDTTLELSGTLTAALASAETVRIYNGARFLGTATIDSKGTGWSFTTTALATGSHSFTARVADAAGNLSSAGAAYTVIVDTSAPPAFTSATTANFAENGTGTVYTTAATANAGGAITYSLSGTDAGLFNLNATTGVLTFKNAPDFEAPGDSGNNNVYDVIITAAEAGNASTSSRNVAITVSNVAEAAPAFTSGTTANFAENGSGTVYTAAATANAGGAITYSLSGTDAGLFNLNATTGVLTFKSAPDFEAPGDSGNNNVYDVIITAAEAGNASTSSRNVAITVSNVAEAAPAFTSGTTANFAENGAGTVYTAAATANAGGAITYSLSGTDAALFNLNATTGVLTFKSAPNFEAPGDSGNNNVYDVIITATEAGNANTATRNLAITVTNVPEGGPTFTSGTTSSFAENGNGTVYTAAVTANAGGLISYSLAGTDAALFNLNASTGVLTFKNAPDFEAPADSGANNVYDVIIIATEAGNANIATRNLAISITDVTEGATAPALQGFTSSGFVDVSSDLQVSFAAPIALGSQGSVQLWKKSGELIESFDAATSSALSFAGNNLTINPFWNLDGSNDYYLTIDAGVVQGTNGIAFSGVSNSSTLAFQSDVEIRGALGSSWLRDLFPGTSSESIGNHSALFIRVTFPDVNRTPGSLEESQAVMNDVAAFFSDNSRGRISLTTTYTPLVSLDFSHQWHVAYDATVNGLSAIQNAARQAALALGFDSNQYNVTVVQLDKALRSGASWGGGDSVWLAWTGDSGTAAHEIGHALGLGHSNSITWDGATNEYGNQTDNMGSGGTGADHFIVPKKTGLGWLDSNDVLANPGPGFYRLYAADLSNQVAGNIYGISQVIPSDQIGSSPRIGLEYRPAQGGEFKDALVLFRNDYVLKYVAAGPIDLSASLGKTYRLPGSEMYLTVLAKGDGYLDVAYQQGPFTGNTAPSAAFTATAASVKRFDAVTFSADAVDAEGDQLVYRWSFSDGDVGVGHTYTRTFNQSAQTNVTVTLEVSDLRGGVATLTGNIATGAASTTGSLSLGTMTQPSFDKPRISVLASDAFAAEGGDAGLLTINRIGTSTTDPLLVNLAWSGSGVDDFTGLPTSVTIPAGQASVAVTVTPTDDLTVEVRKQLSLAIVADTDYTISTQNGSADAQVDDNDLTVVTVKTIDGSASEAERDMGVFRIERTGSTAQALTVYYGLAGTAYNGADYGRLDGQVVIQAGQSCATVTIVPMVDAEGEPEETVTLTLATFNDAYSVGTASTGTVTIKDASSRPTISVANTYGEALVTEGGTAKIVLTANGGSGVPVDVQYTISGNASSGSDFTPQSGTITLPTGGSNTVTLAIPILADRIAENDERLVLTLSPAAAYSLGLDTSAQITILEPINTASGGDRVRVSRWYEANPEEAGSSPASFYLYRDSTDANRQALDVTYALSGTATPGVDYTGEVRLFDGSLLTTFSPAAANSVTIPANADAVVIRLIPVDDALPEGAETINFSIASVTSGAVIGINSTAGYVLSDHDSSATLVGFQTLSSLWQEERNPADNIHTLTVSLNQAAPAGGVQVAYRPDGGTALGYGVDWRFVDQNGNDMPAMNGVLEFAAGETSKLIRLRVVNDRITESKENFAILLENAVGASLQSGASRHTVTLYDVIPEGLVTEERWAGGAVFTNNSWDSSPVSYAGYLDGFTAAQNVGDNFSRRLTGFITAPSTGQYNFYASGDDAVRLYVGTSDAPSSKVLAASVPSGGWTGYQQWDKYSSQQSTAIALVAGQKYYVEVQHQEGGGGDHVSIGWTGPGITSITPISTAAAPASIETRYVRFLTSASTATEGQALAEPILVAIDRVNDSTAITVNLDVVAASSTAAGSDYTLGSTTVSFAPGETVKAVDITALADAANEAAERLVLRLTNASGARIAGPASHTLTIVDANAPVLGATTGFALRGDAAGTLLGQIPASFAAGRSLGSWEILAGNPRVEGSSTPAFAIDNQGRITVANPAALPLTSLEIALTIRATDNQGSSTLALVPVVVNGQQIKEERWNGRDAYHSGDWSDAPATTSYLTAFDAPRDIADNYSRRITGIFTPTSSGEYSFWIAARDTGRLTIAPYNDPTNEVQIAASGDVDYQTWTVADNQQSAPQILVAGNRYILRAYQSESIWGDHLAVAWSGPGFDRQLMPASAFIGAFSDTRVGPSLASERTTSTVDTYTMATTAATDTGVTASISDGSFTRDNTLGLSGTAVAGAIVRVYEGSSLIASTTAANDGSWTLTTPTLGDGDHTFLAEVRDASGNVALTATRTFTVRSAISVASALQLVSTAVGGSPTAAGSSGVSTVLNVRSYDQGVITYDVTNDSNTDVLVADVKTGTVQLVSRGAANASTSAGVSVTFAGTSPDGRYVVFSTSQVTAFGNSGSSFSDTNAQTASPYTDLLVFDRVTQGVRLLTAGASTMSSDSRQAQFVGITADSRYVIYTSDFIDDIGNFVATATQRTWTLVDGGYPTTSGKLKTTALRVADLDPTTMSLQISGGSISNDRTTGTVRLVNRSTGLLSFWVQMFDGDFTKAVKLELSDASTGILVKATQAKYVSGDVPTTDWNTTGNSSSVATSLTSSGYGVSLLQISGANLPAAMASEAVVSASRDVVAFDLVNGTQSLLSHSATSNNLESLAGDVRNVTLSADGRYVLFSAADATTFGNSGTAFTDATPAVTDYLATDLQTGQVRLLSHTTSDGNTSAGAALVLLGTSKNGYAIFSAADVSAYGITDSATSNTDLLAVNLADGTVKLITRASAEAPATTAGQSSEFLQIVGNHVYFTGADASQFGFSGDADKSRSDLFRYDLDSGLVELLSHATSSTTDAHGGSYRAGSLTVSPNGRYVAFVSNMQGSSGGFSMAVNGDALFIADTQTGAIRLVNASNAQGSTLYYTAWADAQNQPKFFTPDSSALVWQTDYAGWQASDATGSASGFDGAWTVSAFVLDLSDGVKNAGTNQLSRLLSHSAAGSTTRAAASVNLVGVSTDSRTAYFTAADATQFGNGGTAFADAATAATDLFAIDLSTRAITLVSGSSGVSFGQSVTFRGSGDGGSVLFSAGNVAGITATEGTLSDPNGSGTDLLALRANLLDLNTSDDTAETGSDIDNITTKRSFVLNGLAVPGRSVQLRDNGVVVATQIAGSSGRVTWSLSNVALGEHTYTLWDTAEQIPLRSSDPTGASSLTVTLVAQGPAAPTMALASDSGRSGSDRITNGATVNLSGLDAGASWQVKVDAGAWMPGSGSSFALTPGTHSYAVRQISAAGVLGSTSTSMVYTLDQSAPTISVASDKIALKIGDTASLTFTLSESATDFDASDITVSGGTLSNVTGSGKAYTATFTPATGSTTPGSVSVASGRFTDVAGNANADGSDSNNTVSFAIDTVAPRIIITSHKSTLLYGETARLTFTLSEAATNFTASDVMVNGGSLSNFTGSGTTYMATFTPATDVMTAIISVSSGRFSDAAGNLNASNTLTLGTNGGVPTVTIASDKSSLKAGDTASLTFTLSAAATDFTVDDINVSGGQLSNFTGSGTSYTATFTPTASSTMPASISVAIGTFSSNGIANTAPSNTLNLAIDTLLPSFNGAVITNDGKKIVLSYSEALAASTAAAAQFTVTANTTPVSVSSAVVVGSTIELSLAAAVPAGQSVTVAYTPPTSGTAVQDVAGNPAAALAATAVTGGLVVVPTINTSIGTDTGLTATVSSGGTTRDTTLTLRGKAVAGKPVTIYDGTTLLGTASLSGNDWTFTTSALASGDHSFTARQSLDAGVTSSDAVTATVRTEFGVNTVQLVSTALGGAATATASTGVGTLLKVLSVNQGVITYEAPSDEPFSEQRWDKTTGALVYSGSLTTLTTAQGVGNNYTRKITGWITAPTTGSYTFYIASDDDSKLFLSSDATAANKEQVASVPDGGWNDTITQWAKYSSQKSTARTLQAGQRYYIEVQHNEGGGGDFASVAWTGPGIDAITPISIPLSIMTADVQSGSVQLASHGAANSTTSAGVAVTHAGTSSDGRYVVFGSSQPTAFGNDGTAFADTNAISGSPFTDLFAYDRTTQALRLLTAGASATTTRSRQAEFVGISADNRFAIYTSDYVETIGGFSAPGKPAASSWVLVDGGYPTASGKQNITTLRVADIDPTKLSFQMSGGYISTDGQSATVSTVTIKRPSTGKLTFWVEGSLENKAVKLELEDTASGILVKATAAKFGAGTNAYWDTQGSAGTVATSLDAAGYGVSLLQATGANLSAAMLEEGAVASRDIVAVDLATGAQMLLSHSAVASNLESQAGDVRNVTLSADGRYVLFTAANATKYGNNGTAFTDLATGVTDLFSADLQTGQLRLLSRSGSSQITSAGVAPTPLGTTTGGWAVFSAADASAFGFADSATGTADLIAVNLADGALKLISRASAGSVTTSAATAVTFEKADGRFVYFSANDATAFGFTSDADTSHADLLRYDPSSGSLELLSHATSSTTAALGGSYRASSLTVSPDGRYVAFVLNMQASSGGFSVSVNGDALFLADTQTGTIRLVNASDSGGQNLYYAAWAGIHGYRRFFTPDSKTFAWDSSYGGYISSDRSGGASGWSDQYGVNAYVVDLSDGVKAAGTAQTNRFLSHSSASTTQAAAANVTLVGVSGDSRLIYLIAADATQFGNGGTAFADAATASTDLFAYDISTRAISLVSGETGASYGQAATFQAAAEGGAALISLGNLSGISAVAGSLTDPNGAGIDLLATRFNLLDLNTNDDSAETGTATDNITTRTNFTLNSMAMPGRSVQLLDNGSVVATQTAPASGLVNWSLSNAAIGEHNYILQDTLEGVPLKPTSAAGAAGLKVMVIADTFAPNDPIINYVSSNDRTPDFRITAEAGSSVKVFDGQAELGLATETATPGLFTYSAAELIPGTHQFFSRATDLAGNSSGLSRPWETTLPPL